MSLHRRKYADGWRMIVSGPDECGHTEQVKRAVAAAGLSEEFSFTPPAYGARKEELYANADLFVLPTFSENFGIVIAEALAAGVPVITTKGTPWEDLRTRQCGWWIDIGVEPLAAALREAISLQISSAGKWAGRVAVWWKKNTPGHRLAGK